MFEQQKRSECGDNDHLSKEAVEGLVQSRAKLGDELQPLGRSLFPINDKGPIIGMLSIRRRRPICDMCVEPFKDRT